MGRAEGGDREDRRSEEVPVDRPDGLLKPVIVRRKGDAESNQLTVGVDFGLPGLALRDPSTGEIPKWKPYLVELSGNFPVGRSGQQVADSITAMVQAQFMAAWSLKFEPWKFNDPGWGNSKVYFDWWPWIDVWIERYKTWPAEIRRRRQDAWAVLRHGERLERDADQW